MLVQTSLLELFLLCPIDIDGSDGKEFARKGGNTGLIQVRKIPGEGNDYPLQYSCLESSTDKETWQAIVHGVAKSQT